MQDSGGIYLTNIDKFFSEFHQSILIYPLRDLMGYVAAEKCTDTREDFLAQDVLHFHNFLIILLNNLITMILMRK